MLSRTLLNPHTRKFTRPLSTVDLTCQTAPTALSFSPVARNPPLSVGYNPGWARTPALTAAVARDLRTFFESEGLVEVFPQNLKSILAACEEPATVRTFEYEGELWALPQTNQMWLEHFTLSNKGVRGFYCFSTSFRAEPNPIPGRHETRFPMAEFEFEGTTEDLVGFERRLALHMGFGDIGRIDYMAAASEFGVEELENEHEAALVTEATPWVNIENFPQKHSFWNMAKWEEGKHKGLSKKIDCSIRGSDGVGKETIGSAERSSDPDQMWESFNTISDGEYKTLLFDTFGEDRVMREMDAYLAYDFFPRCGGGIGFTRFVDACSILPKYKRFELVE